MQQVYVNNNLYSNERKDMTVSCHVHTMHVDSSRWCFYRAMNNDCHIAVEHCNHEIQRCCTQVRLWGEVAPRAPLGPQRIMDRSINLTDFQCMGMNYCHNLNWIKKYIKCWGAKIYSPIFFARSALRKYIYLKTKEAPGLPYRLRSILRFYDGHRSITKLWY